MCRTTSPTVHIPESNYHIGVREGLRLARLSLDVHSRHWMSKRIRSFDEILEEVNDGIGISLQTKRICASLTDLVQIPSIFTDSCVFKEEIVTSTPNEVGI